MLTLIDTDGFKILAKIQDGGNNLLIDHTFYCEMAFLLLVDKQQQQICFKNVLITWIGWVLEYTD